MVWSIPTTALWPLWRLELAVQLCSALLHYQGAVSLVTVVGGSIPMEVKSLTMWTYHTTEREHNILEQYFSIALRVPQQGSSAVTYLVTIMYYRASMWGYTLAPLVSEGHGAHSKTTSETIAHAKSCFRYASSQIRWSQYTRRYPVPANFWGWCFYPCIRSHLHLHWWSCHHCLLAEGWCGSFWGNNWADRFCHYHLH